MRVRIHREVPERLEISSALGRRQKQHHSSCGHGFDDLRQQVGRQSPQVLQHSGIKGAAQQGAGLTVAAEVKVKRSLQEVRLSLGTCHVGHVTLQLLPQFLGVLEEGGGLATEAPEDGGRRVGPQHEVEKADSERRIGIAAQKEEQRAMAASSAAVDEAHSPGVERKALRGRAVICFISIGE